MSPKKIKRIKRFAGEQARLIPKFEKKLNQIHEATTYLRKHPEKA